MASSFFREGKVRQAEQRAAVARVEVDFYFGKKARAFAVAEHFNHVFVPLLFLRDDFFDVSGNFFRVNAPVLVGKFHDQPITHERR